MGADLLRNGSIVRSPISQQMFVGASSAPGTYRTRIGGGLLSVRRSWPYPSRYEGFGFPILEAFAANVPVLTSNRSSMPEIAGNAASLVDPDDPSRSRRGSDELLGDDDLRNVLRAAGTARVASFTWERCARQTVDVIHRAARGDPSDGPGPV